MLSEEHSLPCLPLAQREAARAAFRSYPTWRAGMAAAGINRLSRWVLLLSMLRVITAQPAMSQPPADAPQDE